MVIGLASACVPESRPPIAAPDVVDRSIVAFDIVPAGAFGPPDGGDVGREARMYDSLTPLGGNVASADLEAGFKSARLGFPPDESPASTQRPRAGVEIKRDSYNVPHVVADTDAKAVWAVGWLSAGHAPFLYEAARRNGYLALMGVPGADAVGSALALRVLEPSSGARRAAKEQLDRLVALGPEGEAVVDDIRQFVTGYNAKLDSSFSPLPRWVPADVVALSAFKADWWGRGVVEPVDPGAGQQLRATVGEPARDAFGMALPTRDQAAPASNFAVVSGARSSTGHPMLIGGPQVGFTYPGVAFEVDVRSPSIQMRGLTAPSYPGYVFVGRGSDFAWTINSGLNEVGAVSVPVELCEDLTSYRVGAECRPITRRYVGSMHDLRDLLAPPQQFWLEETEFGPVDWIDTWSVTPRVWVVQRPSAGHDAFDLIGYRRVNRMAAGDPATFRDAMQLSPQAFYVGYIDDENIAAFQTCWCASAPADGAPVADPTELRQPVGQLPSALNPEVGLLTNWNERPAPAFAPPAPGEFRRDWFDAFDATQVHTPATMASAMNAMADLGDDSTFEFRDLTPFLGGPRPAPIRATNRSSAIQLLMSFGDESDA